MSEMICKQCGNTNVFELSQDLYKCDDCHQEINWDLIAYTVAKDPTPEEPLALMLSIYNSITDLASWNVYDSDDEDFIAEFDADAKILKDFIIKQYDNE